MASNHNDTNCKPGVQLKFSVELCTQVDVCAVGGDKVSNALWRSGEGGAVEALAAAGKAIKTDVFILLGINDITARALDKKGAAGKGLEMDSDTGSEKVPSDVIGGVCALAVELKARLQSDCTRIHVLEVPLLPMYDLPGNEGMHEDAEEINTTLRKISAQGGFEVHGWEQRLLTMSGCIMPEWLISPNDVHLNAEGYGVFARLLRSLILQKDSEDVDYHVEMTEEVNPSKERKKKKKRGGGRVQGNGWSVGHGSRSGTYRGRDRLSRTGLD